MHMFKFSNICIYIYTLKCASQTVQEIVMARLTNILFNVVCIEIVYICTDAGTTK